MNLKTYVIETTTRGTLNRSGSDMIETMTDLILLDIYGVKANDSLSSM